MKELTTKEPNDKERKTNENKTVAYQLHFTQEENEFIKESAAKKKESEEVFLQNKALGKNGNKRLKDKRIQAKATDITFSVKRLKQDLLNQESKTELIKDINYLEKDVLELCQI